MTRRSSKSKLDPFIFSNMSNFQPQHRDSILKHMKDLMIRIKDGNITVEETKDRFDNFSTQLQNLIKHYNK
jgi:hypothetical protein